MKKTFTKQYILDNRGCYSEDKVLALPFIDNKRITLTTLFNGLSIRDFSWFLIKKCDLTVKEKQLFALHCAKEVLPIFEQKHPNDYRVRECIDATEKYIAGEIPLNELIKKRTAVAIYADAAVATAVAATYTATYAGDAYTAAADAYTADVDAYITAADAYITAYTYAAYTAYTYAYDSHAYKKSIKKFIKTL